MTTADPETRAAVDGKLLSLERAGNGRHARITPMTTAVPATRAAVDGKLVSLRRAGHGATPVFLQ